MPVTIEREPSSLPPIVEVKATWYGSQDHHVTVKKTNVDGALLAIRSTQESYSFTFLDREAVEAIRELCNQVLSADNRKVSGLGALFG